MQEYVIIYSTEKIVLGSPGKMERFHRILIPVMAKLSEGDETYSYKNVPKPQRIKKITVNRSTKHSPFELIIEVKMKDVEMQNIRQLLEEEYEKHVTAIRYNLKEIPKRNF